MKIKTTSFQDSVCSPKEHWTRDKDNTGIISSFANMCGKASGELMTPWWINPQWWLTTAQWLLLEATLPTLNNLWFGHLQGRLLLAFPKCSKCKWNTLENREVVAANGLYFTVVLSSTGIESLARKDHEWWVLQKEGKEDGRVQEKKGIGGGWRRKEGKGRERSRQVRKGRMRETETALLFSDTRWFTQRDQIASQWKAEIKPTT